VTNLAARLNDAATAGQILLSQRAYVALEGQVEATLVGELPVKGIARPVQAFELLRITWMRAGSRALQHVPVKPVRVLAPVSNPRPVTCPS
jgi:class 3 adenylate cyclase